MKRQNSVAPFVFANFLSALGGGTLLGMGVKDLGLRSTQAFLLGTVLGLGLIVLANSRENRRVRTLFSAACSATSGLLLWLFTTYSVDGRVERTVAYSLFLLLCCRYGLSFTARALRSEAVAGFQMRVSYTELSTSLGTVLGLILWRWTSRVTDWNISKALILDCGLQFSVAFLDRWSFPFWSPERQRTTEAQSFVGIRGMIERLAVTLTAITVGTQIVFFGLAERQEKDKPLILAAFYASAAFAAIICARRKFSLNIGGATDTHSEKLSPIGILPMVLLIITTALLTAATLILWRIALIGTAGALFILATATLGYEIIFLVILDRLGKEARYFDRKGVVSRVIGVAALSCAIAFGLLGRSGYSLSSLLMTTGVCLMASVIASGWRPVSLRRARALPG